jgi:hydroxymethylglutaryl-CoA synthase
MVGIVSYGFYIPKYRLKTEEIARVWGKNPNEILRSLKVVEKSVSNIDEDSLTMGYESSSMALEGIDVDRKEIKAVFFGSESHPYAVNPTSTILAEFLGIEKNYLAYDTEFACKAATGALISGFGLIKSGFCDYGLITASDKATGRPHDALEYTAASGSVSFFLGKKDLILELVDCQSFSSDTPDFWRREGIRYPSHGGRFTGKPAYFHHVTEATRLVLEKNNLEPKDFSQVIFHMPNGKFPVQAALLMGFEKKQIERSLVIRNLGNSYTASALMGFVATLDTSKKDDLVLLTSYGSGAGSDSFVFRVTENLDKRRRNFSEANADKSYIDYPRYLKFMDII